MALRGCLLRPGGGLVKAKAQGVGVFGGILPPRKIPATDRPFEHCPYEKYKLAPACIAPQPSTISFSSKTATAAVRRKVEALPTSQDAKHPSARSAAASWVHHSAGDHHMAWSAPIVSEICVGMEVTSYESAEIDTFN